jgi:hypothetical protein
LISSARRLVGPGWIAKIDTSRSTELASPDLRPAWIYDACGVALALGRAEAHRSNSAAGADGEQYPGGDYEASADIGPDEWITLELDIDDTWLTATVNGTETLALSETKAAPVAGAAGLFVDIGSESFFSNLKITPR